MKWIGLTGGIASGKSSVTKILRDLSYNVIDADAIAVEVVQTGTPGLKSVVQEFGLGILKADKSLDRRKLGQLVFGHPEQLAKLNALIHPLVKARTHELREEVERRGAMVAFYDVPLLFENKMEKDFDIVVVVNATPELQTSRLRSRNQLSEAEIQRRLSSQIPLSDKAKRAQFVIQNDGDLKKLESEVSRLIEFLKSLPAKTNPPPWGFKN